LFTGTVPARWVPEEVGASIEILRASYPQLVAMA